MKRAAAALAIATLALALPASAAADDASLFRAYDTLRDGELARVSVAYERAARKIHRHGLSKRLARRVIAANVRISAAVRDIRDAIADEAPSSDHGTRAKSFALTELRGWLRWNRVENRAFRVWIAGHRRRAYAIEERGWQGFLRTKRWGRRAVRAFAAAGYRSDNGPMTSNR